MTGDALYVRALCDHQGDGEGDLTFTKDTILFVDNTMYGGQLGTWGAWLLDDQGNKLQWGTMPSKSR